MNTIKRFVKAQEERYGQALTEIKNGRKRSHLVLKSWEVSINADQQASIT